MQQQPPNQHGYGPPPSQGYGPPQGYGQPGYGPPPPKKGMSGGMIALIVGGCLFGGCVMCGAIGAASKKDQAPTAAATTTATTATAVPEPKAAKPAPPPKVEEPALAVTAAELFNAYHSNEVRADNQYKGKRLLVSGTVAGVDKDFMDDIVLKLSTSNQFMPIFANMKDSEKSKAGSVDKGDSVKVLCEGEGMVIGHPQLRNCTFK